MKLWLKISLLAIIMVTLATGICSLIMLLRSGQSSLELAVSNALADQQMEAASWSEYMNSNVAGGGYSATAKRTLAKYLIGKFADENTILISGSDFIYNTTRIDPTDYLPVQGEGQQYIITDFGGKTYLVAGSNIEIEDTPYKVYVIKDLSAVYAGVEALSYQFALINFAVIICAGVIIVVSVRLVLRPIAALTRSAGLIAAGIYDKRISVTGNDEVGELAAHFNSMAEAVESRVNELKNAADRREMFMSALTHELKTPMTSISGNAQTLLRTKMDEDERSDALMRIDSECLRVERLSQKLMQLIVLHQNDSIRLEPGSVSALLESVEASCAEQLKQRGLKLKVTNSMDKLVMDKDLLSSLFLNLIDNAGKASKPGDTIELCAQGGVIRVSDGGKGIPPDEIAKITQPFYMVDKSRSRKAGGTGLGLAIADEIARLHGARLQFESEVGRGTTVKVVFEHHENE